jgi:hypothetical protein
MRWGRRLNASSLGVDRKLIAAAAHEVNDQPDDPDEDKQWGQKDEGSDRLRDDRLRAVNGSSVSQAGVSSKNGKIAVDGSALAEMDISEQNGGIAGDSTARIDRD